MTKYQNKYNANINNVRDPLNEAFDSAISNVAAVDAIKAEFLTLLNVISEPLATYNAEILLYV
jgi:hypothetical protein